MLHRRGARMRATALISAAMLVALALSVAALGATPKHGARFRGSTGAFRLNGFSAPVTFTVSHNGRALLNFEYSSLGCFGAGGFQPGVDYYTRPEAIHKVGSVKVTANGHFSVSGATSSATAFGDTTTTTTTVTGRFTKRNSASGSITFSQTIRGAYNATCGPGTLSFSAGGH